MRHLKERHTCAGIWTAKLLYSTHLSAVCIKWLMTTEGVRCSTVSDPPVQEFSEHRCSTSRNFQKTVFSNPKITGATGRDTGQAWIENCPGRVWSDLGGKRGVSRNGILTRAFGRRNYCTAHTPRLSVLSGS